MNALLARVKGLNPTTPTNGAAFAPPVQTPAAAAPAAPAAGLVAAQASQGKTYAFANGAQGMFLSTVDAGGGALAYSFLPVTNGVPGGVPFHAQAGDAIYPIEAAPAAPAPVAAAAVPPPPAFPTGQTPWAAAPPPPPAPGRKLFVTPEVTTTPAPVIAAPPPPPNFAPPPPVVAVPPAAAVAEGRTGPKLAKETKAKAAATKATEVDVQGLIDAIQASKAIFELYWPGVAPTAGDLAPIWQALLGR